MEIKPNVRYPVHTDAAILHPDNLRLVRSASFVAALSLVRCGEMLSRRQRSSSTLMLTVQFCGGLTDRIALIQDC